MTEPLPDQTDTPPPDPPARPSPVPSSHSFPNLREDQISMAMKFLSDPRTVASTSSRAQKEQFLRTKGLTDAEINAAFQRLDASISQTVASSTASAFPSAGGVQLQPVYFPPPLPQQPLPPQEPAWLTLTKTVVGAGAALMAGWWLFNRSRQDQHQAIRQRQEQVENASIVSERDKLLTELLARERQRGSGQGEASDKNKEVEKKREDKVVKMLEEMQKQQLKQHADLIMALKEMTTARNGSVEHPRGSRKAGGVVLDDEEEYGNDTTAAVGAGKSEEPEAPAEATVASECAVEAAVDLEALAGEMDDRMRGTVKMLLGNLVKNPKSDKFRRVNIRTPRFQAQLEDGSSARKFMEQLGFKEEGSYLVWSPSLTSVSIDELGEVKKGLALVSSETADAVKENNNNNTVEEKKSQANGDISSEETASSDTSKRSPLPWMSSAVAATATKVGDKKADASEEGEEECGGVGNLSD